jgi:hypothetical protein
MRWVHEEVVLMHGFGYASYSALPDDDEIRWWVMVVGGGHTLLQRALRQNRQRRLLSCLIHRQRVATVAWQHGNKKIKSTQHGSVLVVVLLVIGSHNEAQSAVLDASRSIPSMSHNQQSPPHGRLAGYCSGFCSTSTSRFRRERGKRDERNSGGVG